MDNKKAPQGCGASYGFLKNLASSERFDDGDEHQRAAEQQHQHRGSVDSLGFCEHNVA